MLRRRPRVDLFPLQSYLIFCHRQTAVVGYPERHTSRGLVPMDEWRGFVLTGPSVHSVRSLLLVAVWWGGFILMGHSVHYHLLERHPSFNVILRCIHRARKTGSLLLNRQNAGPPMHYRADIERILRVFEKSRNQYVRCNSDARSPAKHSAPYSTPERLAPVSLPAIAATFNEKSWAAYLVLWRFYFYFYYLYLILVLFVANINN